MSQNVIEINAAEFDIESVTVYNDRAALKRRFPVDFEVSDIHRQDAVTQQKFSGWPKRACDQPSAYLSRG